MSQTQNVSNANIESTDHGSIEWKAEVDRWDNPVSIIRLVGVSRYYRMVHHSKSEQKKQAYTIYNGRGIYVPCVAYYPTNDCEETSVTIAGYTAYWGDGEAGTPVDNPAGPSLKAELQKIHNDDTTAVILLVLTAIAEMPDMWLKKDVAAKPIVSLQETLPSAQIWSRALHEAPKDKRIVVRDGEVELWATFDSAWGVGRGGWFSDSGKLLTGVWSWCSDNLKLFKEIREHNKKWPDSVREVK